MNQREEEASSQKLQVEVDVIEKVIEELEKDLNSVHVIRSLILQHYPTASCMKAGENSSCMSSTIKNNNDHHHHLDYYYYYKSLEHHSMEALNTYLNSISMLKTYNNNNNNNNNNNTNNCDGVFVENLKLVGHLGYYSEVVSPNVSCTSGVSANQKSYNMSMRRESYKKRKVVTSGESREKEVTHLTYDGFGWRKYGQKIILNHPYPRTGHHKLIRRVCDCPRMYYRCRHKPDQNCEAIKHIQQVSDNPTKYKLIYHGNHTCNNKSYYESYMNMMIGSPKEQYPSSSSTIVLNFDGHRHGPSQLDNNPSLYPYYHRTTATDNSNVGVASNQLQAAAAENHTTSTTSTPIYLEEEYYNKK